MLYNLVFKGKNYFPYTDASRETQYDASPAPHSWPELLSHC